MKNVYNSWAMFHSTDMGDNLEEMVETEDCKVLRMNARTSIPDKLRRSRQCISC